MYKLYRYKHQARAKARYAVKRGEIIKPTICTHCQAEVPLQGHHEDYDKPLDVLWLCDQCHKNIHKKVRIPA